MSPRSVHDVGAEVRALAARIDAPVPAPFGVDEWDAWIASVLSPRWYDAFVAVWRRPWMSLASDTYGSSLLDVLGVNNVFADSLERYPEVTLAEVAARAPNLILLPSEPYEFGPEHAREIEREVTGVPIAFVDGRDLFWWGIRTPPAADRLPGLDDASVTNTTCGSRTQPWKVGADLGVRGGVRSGTGGSGSGAELPDITFVKSVRGQESSRWAWSARPLLVFTAGPAAIVAIPILQRAHLIADTPLWLLLVAAPGRVQRRQRGRADRTRAASRRCADCICRAATAAVSTAWVVYATGWGSILVIGFGVGIADLLRVARIARVEARSVLERCRGAHGRDRGRGRMGAHDPAAGGRARRRADHLPLPLRSIARTLGSSALAAERARRADRA